MPKHELPPQEALYPAPVVLVSCADRSNSRTNIITIAWCGVACSKPPLLTISLRPSRYSNKMIAETGNFAVNIPSADIVRAVDFCGIASGRDIDKFKACSLTRAASSKISSPLIAECPVNIECTIRQTLNLGSHDMFIGEVVCVHVDGSLTKEDGSIDYAKARPFVYCQGEYWDLGKSLGRHGFSGKA